MSAFLRGFAALCLSCAFLPAARAADAKSGAGNETYPGLAHMDAGRLNRGAWRFAVGFAHAYGLTDVKEHVEERLGVQADRWVPLGVTFTPYYEFAHGSRLGLGIGPAGYFRVDTPQGPDKIEELLDVPLDATYGLTFAPGANVSAYFRVGVRYHVVMGDLVDKATPGAFGALGIDVFRDSRVFWQIEAGYDHSRMTFPDGDTTHPAGLTLALRVVL